MGKLRPERGGPRESLAETRLDGGTVPLLPPALREAFF